MNYKLIAVIVVTLTFFFQTFIKWLEMKSADREIPENVRDVYDGPAYRKWLQYYKETTRLDFVRHLLSYLVVYLIIGLDAYAWLVYGVSPKGDYLAALTVMAADLLAGLLVSVPCDYVGTMVVEQKYGFNKMTKKTFILDRMKSTLIELVLMGGLCCLFIWLHKTLGNWLIPVFTCIVFALLLLIVFLYPVLSKAFNKFEPLPEGELRERLCRLLSENGCTVGEIKVMDGSKRSTKANAYFSGAGRTKTIVLYDTLLEQMTPDEIVAAGVGTYAGIKERKQEIRDLVLTDTCPFTLGVNVVNPADHRNPIMSPIIERNSILPSSKKGFYTNASAYQGEMLIKVYQGEGYYCRENIYLGEVRISIPKKKKEENRVEVCFTYDINGILLVEVTDLDNGIKEQAVLSSDQFRLKEEELKQRVEELKNYKLAPPGGIRTKLALARGERLFVQMMGGRRRAVENVMGKLHMAMSTQNDQAIANCLKEAEAVFDFLEGKERRE